MDFQANGDLLINGTGAVFIRRIEAAGTAQGLKFIGQATKLELQMNDEKLIEYSAVEASRAPIKEIVQRRTPTASITMKEFDKHNFALAAMGEEASYTQAGTAITNEVHNDVRQGTYVKLDKRGPISVVTVEPAGGGTAYVVTTDYVITDDETPLIYIVPGGGIADGADIQVDYTPTAIVTALDRVYGATKNVIECEILFVPDVEAPGPAWQIEIWKASLTPESAISVIQQASEFASCDLRFTMLSDKSNHPSAPYWQATKVGT
jgi:hypothetical protein